jgi:hypothetical protein
MAAEEMEAARQVVAGEEAQLGSCNPDLSDSLIMADSRYHDRWRRPAEWRSGQRLRAPPRAAAAQTTLAATASCCVSADKHQRLPLSKKNKILSCYWPPNGGPQGEDVICARELPERCPQANNSKQLLTA